MQTKYLFRTTRVERTMLTLFAVLLVILFSSLLATEPPFRQTVKVGVSYVPPGHIFGLYSQTGFVASQYWYESSLVNYSVPVADSDYLLPANFEERVRLPGWSNDRYTFIRTGYISGSGWFETWETPNGGYIAFVHLSVVSISAPLIMAVPPPRIDTAHIIQYCREADKLDKIKDKLYSQYCLNDDRTGVIVNQLIHTNQGFAAPLSVHAGGYVIGRSGWPTDPFYGNGSAGPYNAHLCVVYDQAGANWLAYVTYQPKPRPKPFNSWLWHRWSRAHKKRSISPYNGKSLSTIARTWNNNTKRCNSVISRRIYSKRSKLTYQRFQDCKITVWSRRGYKPKITHEKHVR